MEETGGKRKAIDSPGAQKNNPSTSSRQNKTRKLDVPEGSRPEGSSQISGNDGSKGSDLTQKLVSMWLGGGSKGRDSILTREVRESIALRECQQKCAEAESLVQKFQKKVQNAEIHIKELTREYNLEKREKDDLIDKINATAEMVSTITEHINYANDSLSRCRHHREHLANVYDNIILGQRAELGKLRSSEDSLKKQITELRSEIASLKESTNDIRTEYENKIIEKDAKLASVTAKCDVVQEHLDRAMKEKEEISRALSMHDAFNVNFQNKILEYETDVKNLNSQLAKASASLDIANEENAKLQNDLTTKNKDLFKLVEDFDSFRAKHVSEVAAIKNINVELEEKLKRAFDERENLDKMLKETTVLKNELSREIEKLKDDTSGEIKEMERRLENAEKEKTHIREESKKVIDEMEKRYASHVEKYNALDAEMTALEARHRNELSRINQTSNTSISSAKADKNQLERQLDTLRREKEEQELELRRVEDLLVKHTESELQLQRKLENCKNEVSALAASAAATATYKKTQDAEMQENIKKISDLEKKLLKLQFDQKKSVEIDKEEESQTIGTVSYKGKETSSRKASAVSTYQKSILKRSAKSRKPRSSPSQPSAKKRISFLELESPDASPVKLTDPSNFLDSEDVNDDVIDLGKSSSQPLPASQTISENLSLFAGKEDNSALNEFIFHHENLSQYAGKKFFKSRNSQSK